MAEVPRMTGDDVVSYFVEGKGVDFLRESLTWDCQLMKPRRASWSAPGSKRWRSA